MKRVITGILGLLLLVFGIACRGGAQPQLSEVAVIPSPVASPTEEEFITPLPPSVVPGKLVVETMPGATVILRFWTKKWVPHPNPPPEMPNLRELIDIEIPGATFTAITDSNGRAEFTIGHLPSSKADITIEGAARIHFQAALTPYFGALFVVPEVGGRLFIDYEKTEFDPGVPAGEYHGPGTLKADQQASLTVLPDDLPEGK
jgi:hypothetical protein